MVKQNPSKRSAGAVVSQDAISDPRFASFGTDPRFRLPSKKHTRTKIDKRFSRMLEDDDFANTAKVDRYGRKLSNAGKKQALQRLYQPEEDDEDESGAEEEADIDVEDDQIIARELRKADAAYDPARGGGFSSSDEEEDDEDDDDEDGGVEVEVDEPEFPALQAEQSEVPMGEVTTRIAVVNMDWDNVRAVDLMAVFSSFVQPGSSVKKISVFPSEFGKERMEREEMEGPPKELFAKKPRIEEEKEESDSEDETEDEEALEEKIKKDLLKEDKGEEFDSTALRQYQLERLRYYYAVMICSDKETANHIYTATDGTEYLSSANFFDLRFIPDDVEFDDKPRDECKSVPGGYRPTEFVTDALQHSKVKLSWDAEDGERKDVIKRAFTGSRADIGENDLRAYLGSDSSSDEDDEAPPDEEIGDAKPTKKELARQKLRAALGLSDEPALSSKSKTKGHVGDMQISFTPGLSAKDDSKASIFENEPIKEETTAEAYIRKEKERKARRREKAKALREGRDPNVPQTSDAQNQAAVDAELDGEVGGNEKDDQELGFADPFFTSDPATREKSIKSKDKEARRAKRAQKEAEAAAQASERAKLELLMADDNVHITGADGLGDGKRLDHFNINEIERAEKAAAAKKKRTRTKRGRKKEPSTDDANGTAGADRSGKLQQSFHMPVDDPRFAALYEKHEYAIDPSNPRFRGTEGMRALLEEGRRKRRFVGDGDDDGDGEADAREEKSGKEKKTEKKKASRSAESDGLLGLVESVKKKVKR